MPLQPSIQAVNIVVIGAFSPIMFHPSWLNAHDLIRQEEADAAKIKTVSPQATIFTLEWLEFMVLPERLQLLTNQESHYEVLRDLGISVLQLLNNTPLRALGINRQFHYSMESEEAWHYIGDRLAPKEDWRAIVESPWLRSLLIEAQRNDDEKGYLLIKVEPSARLIPGVFIEINDHYDLRVDGSPSIDTEKALEILTNNWQYSMRQGLEIPEYIIALGENQ